MQIAEKEASNISARFQPGRLPPGYHGLGAPAPRYDPAQNIQLKIFKDI